MEDASVRKVPGWTNLNSDDELLKSVAVMNRPKNQGPAMADSIRFAVCSTVSRFHIGPARADLIRFDPEL